MLVSKVLPWLSLALAASVEGAALKATTSTAKTPVPAAKTSTAKAATTAKTSTAKAAIPTAKTSTAKAATTAKTSTAKAAIPTVKTSTAKVATTAKTSTAKAGTTAKTSTAKAATTAKVSTAKVATTVKPKTATGTTSPLSSGATTYTAPLQSATGTAATVGNTTLVPVDRPCAAAACTPQVVPSKNVTLHYGLTDDSMVMINMAMNHSTVVLEDLPSVETVDCDKASKSVSITFNNTADFTTVTGSWANLVDQFLLITNHQGDCDAELERGFFLADVDTMSVNQRNMSVRVFAQETDLASTGASMELTFNNLPALEARHDLKRDITLQKNGFTLSTDINLDPGIQIGNSGEAGVLVTVDHAQINSSVTFSGALKYTFHDQKLHEFWFDVKKNIYQDLALTIDFQIPKSYELMYDIPVVSYAAIDIPGIINLGPEIELGIGIAFAAKAQVEVTTQFSSRIVDGHAHVDFKDSNKTTVSNWTATHTGSANISESGTLSMTPKVVATAELACTLFNDVLDLSTGVEASASFPLKFGATASQEGATGIALSNGEDCANGFGYSLDFAIKIKAFATSWLKKEWEVYEKPIGAWCMPWLSL